MKVSTDLEEIKCNAMLDLLEGEALRKEAEALYHKIAMRQKDQIEADRENRLKTYVKSLAQQDFVKPEFQEAFWARAE